MKKKTNLKNKLSLKKSSIARLDNIILSKIKAGVDDIVIQTLQGVTCEPTSLNPNPETSG